MWNENNFDSLDQFGISIYSFLFAKNFLVPYRIFFTSYELVSWGPFLEGPESFWARKAIFSSSVSKNGEVYAPECSCMKGTFVHIKNMQCEQNRSVIARLEILPWLY